MKRGKIFSILTSAAMVFSLSTPLNVFAEETTGLPEPVNGVITLTQDTSNGLTVSNGEVRTLDLNGNHMSGAIVNKGTLTIKDSKGNGKVAVTGNHAITNEGTLTIESGTFDALSHAKAALFNDVKGKADVKNGTFLRSKENGSSKTENGGNSFYNIQNKGDMTIENATVKQTGHYSSLVANGWYNGTENTSKKEATLTINDGNFDGGLNTIKNDDYGVLTINNGTFSNVTQMAVMNNNVTTIADGTFNSDKMCVQNYYYNETMNKGLLTISGGKFYGGSGYKTIENYNDNGKITITGGTFSSDVTQYLNKTTDTTNILKYKAYKVDGKYQVAACAYDFDPSDTEGLVNGTLRIEEGKERTIKVLVKPYTSLDKPVFTSENEKVAKVDANGKVTAVSIGTTKINIVVGDLDSYINISVYKNEEPEKSPTIDTTKPVEEVKVGVNDESVNETLKETTNEIISAVNDSIDNPKDAATTAINEKTKENLNKAIADGKSISTKVKVEEIKEDTLDKETQEKVEKEIEKLSTGNKTDAIVCQYLDLSVALLADGEEIGNVNELNKEVEFKIAIPKDLLKEGRKFYVVRVHNGEVEVLETTLNEDGTLSFKTNKFSTYAVVYEDAKEPAKDPSTTNPSVTPVTVPSAKAPEVKSEAKKEESKKVKTGDESKTMLYVELGLMAIVGCAIILLQSKKTKALNK